MRYTFQGLLVRCSMAAKHDLPSSIIYTYSYLSPIDMSWAWPSASLLLPPLVLTLQASLLQVPQSSALRVFRVSLGILSSITIDTSCSTFFEPKKDFILFNAVIHIAKAWAILRSIEFATARHEYTWIGYQRAYDSQERPSRGKAENHRSFLQAIYYGCSCVCSMYGLAKRFRDVAERLILYGTGAA